jgi:hypothetical protein
MDLFSNLYYTDAGNKGYFPNIAESDVVRGNYVDGYRSAGDGGESYYREFQADPNGSSMNWANPLTAQQKYGTIWDNMFDTGNPNFMFGQREGEGDLWNLMVKSADKEGSNVAYGLKDGYYQPIQGSQSSQYWDTNSSFQNASLLKLLTAAIGGAYAGGAFGGGELAGAGTNYGMMGAEGAVAGGEGLGSMMGLEQFAGMTPTAVTGGAGAGLGALGGTAMDGAAGAIAGGAGVNGLEGLEQFAGSIPNGAGAGLDLMQLLKNGGSGLLDLLKGGGAGGGNGGLGQLLAALYGSYSNNQNAGDLKDLINQRNAQMQPFQDRLNDLYNNPQGWLEGPEAQALKRIDENRLLRTDSKRGNLGNDLPRSAALQDRMMGHLNTEKDNRSQALQPFMDSTNRLNDMYMMASMMKNSQFNPLLNYAGGQQQSGGGFNLEDIIGGIQKLFGGAA